jgi:S1-C subfamily serine protease
MGSAMLGRDRVHRGVWKLSATKAAVNALQAVSDQLANIAERIGGTVVGVHARRRIPSSGIVWARGVVVTSAHTIRREEGIRVLLPGADWVDASLAGRDAGSDIAVLRVPTADIEPAERGDPASLRVGHFVVALGRFAASHVSLDYGLVAAVGPAWRTWLGGEIERLVALDGGLRPGYSGGPLVDARGQVMGIGTSAFMRGTGTLVPIGTVARIADELLAHGRVFRGYLGLGLQPAELPAGGASGDAGGGLLVAAVQAGGPAEKAGVIVGDVLVSLDGKPCRATEDVLTILSGVRPQQAMTAVFSRGGARREITLVVGERAQRQYCR